MEREAITTEEVFFFLTMQLIVSPINTNTQFSTLSKIYYHCSLYSVSDLAAPIPYQLTPTHGHMCAITTDLSGSCDCITEQSLFSRKFPYSQRGFRGPKGSFCNHCGSFHCDCIQNAKYLDMWTADITKQDSILIWLSHLILTNCQNNNKRIANLKYWRFQQQPIMNRETMSTQQPLGRDRCSPWNGSDWEFQTVPFDFLWNLIFTK